MTTPSPTLRLIQITDPHLVEEGKLLRNVMDTPNRMRDALDKVLTLGPAAVILSGDIGQRNHYVHDDVAAYIGHFQDQLGIPFIAVGSTKPNWQPDPSCAIPCTTSRGCASSGWTPTGWEETSAT